MRLQERLAVAAVLSIVAGFGMMHSVSGAWEIVSLAMIGIGTAFLVVLLLKNKTHHKKE